MLAAAPLLRRREQDVSTQALAEARARRDARRAQLQHVDGLPMLSEAHVLLITIDALRADHLGFHGYQRPVSPFLDELAAASAVFERCYAQAPHSSYSLSSLMASEYLHETVDLGIPLPEETLATTLRADGYHTSAYYTLGIFHTEGERLSTYRDNHFGFELQNHRGLDAEQLTDAALDEFDRVLALGEPPALMWTHYFDVHEPYEATRFGTDDIDRYDSEIARVDTAVARLVRDAREKLDRPVVIIVTADHGEEFRDHGGLYHGSALYEEQVRVPLIIHVPGQAPTRYPRPVEMIDIAPTVLSLVGTLPPSTMRGDDLRAALAGHTDADFGPVFSAVSHKRMVIDWPKKLIADLRFNLFEVYDLEVDPRERQNLADGSPELLDALKGETYAWLDSLNEHSGDAVEVALATGRLGDRRAVPALAALIRDEAAESLKRQEAGRILGKLADVNATEALLEALGSEDARVAAEAAIALGRMFDERAKAKLRDVVHTEDVDLRVRAAVSLGRLRDTEAVPALIDASRVATDRYEREESVRWLGRLQDPRALEPLVGLLPEFRVRQLAAIALGHLGDPRGYEPLVDVFRWDTHTNVRDQVTRALGQLGDPRAIELLVPLAVHEVELRYVGESLVRLGAIGGAIGGADLSRRTRGRRGFGVCQEGPALHDWNYLHQTSCATQRESVEVPLAVPDAVRAAPIMLFSARRADDSAAVQVELEIGESGVIPLEVDGRFVEHRVTLPALSEGRASLTLRIPDGATLDVDHVLLLPGDVTALQPPTPAL